MFAINSQTVQFYLDSGKKFLDLGEYSSAYTMATSAISLCCSSPCAHRLQAIALEALGCYAESLQAYDRSLMYEETGEVRLGRGRVLLALGRNDDALQALDRSLALKETHEAHYCRGRALLLALGRN